MALNNTTDRYNYIFGNNAKKADRFATPHQVETSPVKTKIGTAREISKKRTQKAIAKTYEAFDWKYTIMIIAALAVLSVSALFYVKEASVMNDLAHQVKVLNSQKAELKSKQVAIRSEIDKTVNLEEIRKYAEKKLNMTYPDHTKVIYYTQDSEDYFRQYESVDKK